MLSLILLLCSGLDVSEGGLLMVDISELLYCCCCQPMSTPLLGWKRPLADDMGYCYYPINGFLTFQVICSVYPENELVAAKFIGNYPKNDAYWDLTLISRCDSLYLLLTSSVMLNKLAMRCVLEINRMHRRIIRKAQKIPYSMKKNGGIVIKRRLQEQIIIQKLKMKIDRDSTRAHQQPRFMMKAC